MRDPSRPRRPVRLARDTTERITRTAWPSGCPTVEVGTPTRVSVVTVSYSTALLTARLLVSVHRVLPVGSIDAVVVVDNGSDDGSRPMLHALADAGLITLIENRRLPYHGPGLNRGVSHLAQTCRAASTTDPESRECADVVWLLDSDAAILSASALERGLEALARPGVVMAGQHQPYDQRRPALSSYAHPASLMLDVAAVWRHSVPAFLEDGAPAVLLQHVAHRRGGLVADVRFFDDELVLHLGSGTLGELVRSDRRDNRYHEWALEHRDHHFHGVPRGPELLARLDARFSADVPTLTPDAVVEACRRNERWVV